MIGRIIASFVVLFIGGIAEAAFNTLGGMQLGKTLGDQLRPSDTAFAATKMISYGFGLVNIIIALTVIAAIIFIWYSPVRKWIATLAVALLVLVPTQKVDAYYADSDYAETFMILPNESAFWLPDVGDNKSSQVAFGSEEYYRANKIAAKRFDVSTHVRLPNSGIFANKYVSPGRLIKVDRSPAAREWVKASHRGTGTKDESLPCQSVEGLDITVGVSIGTSVKEENAPKFLYTFGVNPPKGDPNDPNVVFTSVYYGKSLSQVMDEKVRPRVQSLVCDEVTKRTLDKANSEAALIMASIQKQVAQYAETVGITLDFIGWADTFEFDQPVQAAINRAYIATKDLEVAMKLAPHTSTIQSLANAEAVRTLSGKWTGDLPNTLSLWGPISDMFSGIVKAVTPKQ